MYLENVKINQITKCSKICAKILKSNKLYPKWALKKSKYAK